MYLFIYHQSNIEFVFYTLPFYYSEAIGGTKIDIVGRNLCDALSKDWEATRRVLRRATLQGINGNKRDSVRRLNWGPEKLTVGYRSYRYIHIGRLLLMTLFGENLSKFFAYERREYGNGKSRRKWNLFHIGSYYRMKKLFTINHWCGVEFDGDAGRRTCCGRVAVRRRVDGRMRSQNGFVIEETSDRLRCRLENKSLIWLKKPKWKKDVGYVYFQSTNNSYCIYEYDPVRLYIALDGDIQILFHRITLQHRSNYLIFE